MSDIERFLEALIGRIGELSDEFEGGYDEAALIVDECLPEGYLGDAGHAFISQWISEWMSAQEAE